MEQQTATETKNVIKKTIPNKQKSGIKLVMWTLSQVMEKDAMIAKIIEMFKLTDTIETIIEMVDAVEKSPEYTMMDTELTAIRSPKTKKHAKVTGDPDAIIKQLVDMATTETATGKKKVKAPKVEGGNEDEETNEPKKKAPRGKKAATPTTDVEVVATEPKKKAPRGKKAADTATPTTDVEVVVTEPKKKAPRGKKPPAAAPTTEAKSTDEAPEAPKAPATEQEAPKAPATEPEAPKAPATEPEAPKAPATEPKAKKTPAKKTKTTVESNGTAPEPIESTEPAPTKTKAPKAPKTKTPSEIAHPNEVVEVAEDLREDEYMLLNEVEVDGKTYMVDSSQTVYNEFNDVIGKYENGVVTMNA